MNLDLLVVENGLEYSPPKLSVNLSVLVRSCPAPASLEGKPFYSRIERIPGIPPVVEFAVVSDCMRDHAKRTHMQDRLHNDSR